MLVNHPWVNGFVSCVVDVTVCQATLLTPDQLKICELEKRIKRIEEEKEILKKATALYVGLTEQFTIIKARKEGHAVKLCCHLFSVHRSSYKDWAWREQPIKPESCKNSVRYTDNTRFTDESLNRWEIDERAYLVSC